MSFEEEFFELLKARAEMRKNDFIDEYGTEEELDSTDRLWYEINFKNTTKTALSRFNDRINCGGYAFEMDACFFPNGEEFSNYISGILDNFKFIRLLGDELLHDDEYLVFYRFINFEENDRKNEGHHFVKVEDDGLVVEKFGCGAPMIFEGWKESYKNSPEVVFAVKKNHDHYFDSKTAITDFAGGLNFEQAVSKAIVNSSNDFSYHSHNYRLKKSQEGEVFVTDKNGEIVADVLTDGTETAVQIFDGKEEYVENYSGPVKPIIEKGKLINYDDFKENKSKDVVDR